MMACRISLHMTSRLAIVHRAASSANCRCDQETEDLATIRGALPVVMIVAILNALLVPAKTESGRHA
jgi:hypothetical protein